MICMMYEGTLYLIYLGTGYELPMYRGGCTVCAYNGYEYEGTLFYRTAPVN